MIEEIIERCEFIKEKYNLVSTIDTSTIKLDDLFVLIAKYCNAASSVGLYRLTLELRSKKGIRKEADLYFKKNSIDLDLPACLIAVQCCDLSETRVMIPIGVDENLDLEW